MLPGKLHQPPKPVARLMHDMHLQFELYLHNLVKTELTRSFSPPKIDYQEASGAGAKSFGAHGCWKEEGKMFISMCYCFKMIFIVNTFAKIVAKENIAYHIVISTFTNWSDIKESLGSESTQQSNAAANKYL